MKILDAQGRLFGKISILDFGAALVILLVMVGIFFYPGTSGSVAQVGVTTKPVEVDVLVVGLKGRASQTREMFKVGDKTNLIIRNQPYGQVTLKKVEFLPRIIPVVQPNGTLKALPDPTAEIQFNNNLILTIEGKAQLTENGAVLGNSKVKVGTTVELESKEYNFNGTVIEVRAK